jgi:hypothetical protein
VTVRFNLFMTQRQYDCLSAEADRTGLAMSELVRRAVDRTLRPEVRPKVNGVELSVGLWRRPDAAVAGRRPGIKLRD